MKEKRMVSQQKRKRKRSKNFRSLLSILSAAVIFSYGILSFIGCEKKPESPVPLRGKITEKKPIKTKKRISTDEKEERRDKPLYVYNPQGKRDPFRPFILATTQGKKEENVKGRTPLERYQLSQLKVVGIIWGESDHMNTAMVEDPISNGYILKRGTRIGRNNGRVIQILNDRVVVREKYRDYFGKMTSRKTSLKLHLEEEGEIQ
ncbi:MAG: pilus assembly protein PilP [Thermodesulfobacteriota bacterium]|nr:pilus assembly protein PilP [Thermodesulfobacteriota bacterium]